MSSSRKFIIIFLVIIWVFSTAGSAVVVDHQPLQLFMPNHGGFINPDSVTPYPYSAPGDLVYDFNKFEDEPALLLHNITDTEYEVWFIYTPVGITSGGYVGSIMGLYYNGSFIANNPAGYYSGSGRWPDSMKYIATITYAQKPDSSSGAITDHKNISLTKTIFPSSVKLGTDSRVSITLSNTGQFPIHDIEILDTLPREFSLTSGKSQYAIPGVIESNETRILEYSIKPQKAGLYTLNVTQVMYADHEGNYHKISSNPVEVDVIESLISPTYKQEQSNPLQELISYFGSWLPFFQK